MDAIRAARKGYERHGMRTWSGMCKQAQHNYLHAGVGGVESRFPQIVICNRIRDRGMVLVERGQNLFQLFHFLLLSPFEPRLLIL